MANTSAAQGTLYFPRSFLLDRDNRNLFEEWLKEINASDNDVGIGYADVFMDGFPSLDDMLYGNPEPVLVDFEGDSNRFWAHTISSDFVWGDLLPALTKAGCRVRCSYTEWEPGDMVLVEGLFSVDFSLDEEKRREAAYNHKPTELSYSDKEVVHRGFDDEVEYECLAADMGVPVEDVPLWKAAAANTPEFDGVIGAWRNPQDVFDALHDEVEKLRNNKSIGGVS